MGTKESESGRERTKRLAAETRGWGTAMGSDGACVAPAAGGVLLGVHEEAVQPLGCAATRAAVAGEAVSLGRAGGSYAPVRAREGAVRRWRHAGLGHAACAAGAAVVLCCCAAVLFAGAGSGAKAGATGGVSLAVVGGNDRGRAGQLTGKALADVKQMYAQNPELVKEFALLTGSSGQRLLSQVAGTHTPAQPKTFRGPSLHTLDTYMQQLSTLTSQEMTEAQVRRNVGTVPSTAEEATRLNTWGNLDTVDVNKRTAWMLVKDLSQDWDKSSNLIS